MSIASDYPNFVCSSCESDLSQYAYFTRQIERNAENWEIFLKSENDVKVHKDELVCTDYVDYNPMNGIEEIKIEYCDESFNVVPEENIFDGLDPPPVDSEGANTKRTADASTDNAKTKKSRTSKPERKLSGKFSHSNRSIEFERTCQLCDAPTFSSLGLFYKHQQQQHPGEKRFSCDICGNKFNNKNPLLTHMKDRHSNCGKKHQCQFCAKLFYSDREVILLRFCI